MVSPEWVLVSELSLFLDEVFTMSFSNYSSVNTKNQNQLRNKKLLLYSKMQTSKDVSGISYYHI